MMQTTIKRAVPLRLRKLGHSVLDKASFLKVARKDFDHARLIRRDRIDLAQIWTCSDFAPARAEDAAELAAVYGDQLKRGGVNPGECLALYSLIAHLKPRSVLEIGTHIGSSTAYIARAMKRFSPTDWHLDTVDIFDVNAAGRAWSCSDLGHSPDQIMDMLGVGGNITFHATGALPFMARTEKRFDLIFLDGDHSAKAVYDEASAALRLLNIGGTILLHDYYPNNRKLFPRDLPLTGPFDAMSRIMRENPNIHVVPFGDIPWETRPKSNKAVLALVAQR